jgi:hypothetical protein
MEQGADDLDPGRITENLEEIRQVQQGLLFGHVFTDIRHYILVDGIAVAVVDFRYVWTHLILLS